MGAACGCASDAAPANKDDGDKKKQQNAASPAKPIEASPPQQQQQQPPSASASRYVASTSSSDGHGPPLSRSATAPPSLLNSQNSQNSNSSSGRLSSRSSSGGQVSGSRDEGMEQALDLSDPHVASPLQMHGEDGHSAAADALRQRAYNCVGGDTLYPQAVWDSKQEAVANLSLFDTLVATVMRRGKEDDARHQKQRDKFPMSLKKDEKGSSNTNTSPWASSTQQVRERIWKRVRSLLTHIKDYDDKVPKPTKPDEYCPLPPQHDKMNAALLVMSVVQPVEMAAGLGLPVEVIVDELMRAVVAGLYRLVMVRVCSFCQGSSGDFVGSITEIVANAPDSVCWLCTNKVPHGDLERMRVLFVPNKSWLYVPIRRQPTCAYSDAVTGKILTRLLVPRSKVGGYFVDVDLKGGSTYTLMCRVAGLKSFLEVGNAEAPAAAAADGRLDYFVDLADPRVSEGHIVKFAHGHIRMKFKNNQNTMLVINVVDLGPDEFHRQLRQPVAPQSYVSAARLIHRPLWARHFSYGHPVAPNQSLVLDKPVFFFASLSPRDTASAIEQDDDGNNNNNNNDNSVVKIEVGKVERNAEALATMIQLSQGHVTKVTAASNIDGDNLLDDEDEEGTGDLCFSGLGEELVKATGQQEAAEAVVQGVFYDPAQAMNCLLSTVGHAFRESIESGDVLRVAVVSGPCALASLNYSSDISMSGGGLALARAVFHATAQNEVLVASDVWAESKMDKLLGQLGSLGGGIQIAHRSIRLDKKIAAAASAANDDEEDDDGDGKRVFVVESIALPIGQQMQEDVNDFAPDYGAVFGDGPLLIQRNFFDCDGKTLERDGFALPKEAWDI